MADLTKAKVELMARSVFISTIALSVKYKITDTISTAATDGTSILFNPDFIKDLSKEQLTGLLAHECWHIAFRHMSRLQERDRVIWNMAGDYVINNMLVKEGYTLPVGGLVDHQYDNMSTEQVYIMLKANADKLPNLAMEDLIEGTGSKEDKSLQDQEIIDIIVKASTQSKMAGKYAGEVPGEIDRMVDELINPRLDWKTLLQRFLTHRVKTDYSWRRPNKRFAPKFYLPTQYSESIGNLYFAIDTSGSVTNKELQDILSEIKGIKQIFNPEKMYIMDCDRCIHNIHEVDDVTAIESLKFTGGGGTDLTPPVMHCEEEGADALIYFTDLYAEQRKYDVNFPILWICTSGHEPHPVGETVYL